MSKTVILIPCYNPNNTFTVFYNQLAPYLNENLLCLLVNDGSTDKNSGQLLQRAVEQNAYTSLLSYTENKGKGYAVKYGISYLLDYYKDLDLYVVMADCDGQHTVSDILATANTTQTTDQLVLGVREYSGEWMPWKSRLGHALSNFIYKVLFGLKLTDTHCGLRGFNRKIAEYLLSIPGNRFDFECAMIPLCAKRFGLQLQSIVGIYDKATYKTTYKLLRDWWLICVVLLKTKIKLLKKQ